MTWYYIAICQKNEIRTFSNLTHRNKLKIIKDLNVRGKHRQKNLGHKLQQYPFGFFS